MKIAISLPEPLFKEAEATAKELGMSRSRLIRIALEEFLKCRRGQAVAAALSRSLEKHPDEIDPFLQHLVLEGMRRAEWEE